MAIAFDAVSFGEGAGTDLNGTVMSHVCTGSNLILILGLTIQTGATVTSVSYGGVAMTLIDEYDSGGSGQVKNYYLIAPATGSNDVAVVTNNNGAWKIGATSYTGVRQILQPDSNGETNGSGTTDAAISRTSVANNCWHVGWISSTVNGAVTLTAGASTTMRTTTAKVSGMFDNNAAITPAGANTLHATQSASNTFFAVSITISPAILITLTETVTLTDAITYLRTIIKSLTEVVSVIQVTIIGLAEYVLMAESTFKLKKKWKNIAKNLVSWRNEDK